MFFSEEKNQKTLASLLSRTYSAKTTAWMQARE